MAKILHRAEFFSVIGEIVDKVSPVICENVLDCEDSTNHSCPPQLHLVFTLQVNGRLKDFEWYFTLDKVDNGYTLKDWGEWFVVLRLLSALGYVIVHPDESGAECNIILKWIDKIMEAY